MNVSRKYHRLSLMNLLGVPAILLLASPVLAQSGFVPIGKPQPPIIIGNPPVSQPSDNFAPPISKPEFRSGETLQPMGTRTIESNRPTFGGLNYGAPQGGVVTQPSTTGTKTTDTFSSNKKIKSGNTAPPARPSRSVGVVSTQQPSFNQGGSSSTTKAQINVDTCSVHLIDDIKIPSKESGVLSELNVKEGDAVPGRKIIGTIDATLLQIEMERAATKLDIAMEMASDRSAIDVAKKKYALAKYEYEVAKRLANKGSKSNQEMMRAKYSKDASAAEVTVASMQQREAMGQAKVEEVNLKQIRQMMSDLRVESPFDGHVLELYKHTGEWVNKGDEIAHFARIDRVWVEGTVSSSECNVQDVMGQQTIITLRQAGGDSVSFNGTIVSIPLAMEGGGNRFRVKAEVANRFENGVWLLRPGAQLSMKIDLSPNTAKRSANNMQR